MYFCDQEKKNNEVAITTVSVPSINNTRAPRSGLGPSALELGAREHVPATVRLHQCPGCVPPSRVTTTGICREPSGASRGPLCP